MPATYDSIASVTLGSASASVTFSSIPSTYTDLVLVESFQFTGTGSQSLLSFGDTSSLYSSTTIRGDGSTASSIRFSGVGSIGSSPGQGNGTANVQVNCIRQIMNYSNTTTNKTVVQRFNDSSLQVVATVGLWRNTAAINTVVLTSLSGNFASGSTFTLYGIKAA